MFVLDRLPAWSTNRLSRLVKAPKRYLTDTSLLSAALHLDEVSAVMRDGNLLGRLIETHVLAQIRPELELAGFTPRLYHLREKNGRHEIDLVAELSAGNVVAIEIKSSAAPTRATPGTWSGCASNSASVSSSARCSTLARDHSNSPSGSSRCRSARYGGESDNRAH